MLQHHRIAECQLLLDSGNLSLATRRAMDLTLDFDELLQFRAAATAIRKSYNLKRELGESELTGANSDQLVSDLARLLREMTPLLAPHDELSHPVEANAAEVRNIEKRFSNRGHRFALGPIDLTLRSGTITGVVGENGNGKTTLLRILAGDLQPDSGNVIYEGLERLHMPKTHYELKQQTAFIPQRLKRWNGTLLQNLKLWAAMHGLTGKANEERVDFVVHRFGLTRFQHLSWPQLSTGYKLRFELAKMVVWFPRLLVLDEPVANLDLVAQQLFLQDLRHLAQSVRYPLGIIMSSQQLHAVEQVADQLVFLRNGQPIFVGNTATFGADRTHNTFEVAGTFDRQQLVQSLATLEHVTVEEAGISQTIRAPREIDAAAVLGAIVGAGLEINYFRDISSSTRQLLSE